LLDIKERVRALIFKKGDRELDYLPDRPSSKLPRTSNRNKGALWSGAVKKTPRANLSFHSVQSLLEAKRTGGKRKPYAATVGQLRQLWQKKHYILV
jgi:hypothetical protein